MDKKKAIIYPYDCESTYFFRHNGQNKEFNVVGAVAPKGWGITGKDVGSIDGSEEEFGISIKNSFDDFYHDFDTVIIIDSHLELDFDQYIYPKIKELIRSKKEVVCLRHLTDDQLNKIKELSSRYITCVSQRNHWLRQHDSLESFSIMDINTPIIFVTGLSSRTHKFEIQLSLRAELLGLGYSVSQVGTKNHCEFFGFHSYPSFMMSNSISESAKVIMFNRYIKEIEEREKTDAIIIGIPEGIMAINRNFTDGFGISAYLVSQAVKPDVNVFSVSYGQYTDKFFNDIDNLFKYRFGYNVDCINFSNFKLDYQESNLTMKKLYTIIDSDFIDNKKNKYRGGMKPIYNILNVNDRRRMTNHIIDLLSGEDALEDIL
ncbi:TIGR04066 family peptide maturation system protein [Wukongibacter baidiensis]|uniref:TIGR04066 family peptide maturation system protein n=1 Tax=Wukongibacter baidiensis TaxID=1723361 RepID=UPI003D7F20F5